MVIAIEATVSSAQQLHNNNTTTAGILTLSVKGAGS